MRYAYVPLMAMVISTNCAGSEIPEVTLQEQNYQGIIQLVGDLDVGEVDSQSEIDKQFILINKSDTKLSFAGVRPTCSCTNVVLKKGSIEPGMKFEHPLQLKVKVPKVFGKKTLIAEVRLYDESKPDAPSATLRVVGDVHALFAFSALQSNVQLGEQSKFSHSITFHIAHSVDVKQITASAEHSDFTFKVSRIAREKAELTIEGTRAKALDLRDVAVDVKCLSDGRELKEKVLVQFFDGTSARTFSPRLSKDGRTLTFRVLKKSGLDASKVTVESDRNVEMKCSVVQEHKGILLVTIAASNLLEVDTLRVLENKKRLVSLSLSDAIRED